MLSPAWEFVCANSLRLGMYNLLYMITNIHKIIILEPNRAHDQDKERGTGRPDRGMGLYLTLVLPHPIYTLSFNILLQPTKSHSQTLHVYKTGTYECNIIAYTKQMKTVSHPFLLGPTISEENVCFIFMWYDISCATLHILIYNSRSQST